MINIGIIEADSAYRQELKNFINIQPELVCSITAESIEEFLQITKSKPTVFVILVSSQGFQSGKGLYEEVKFLKSKVPDSDIIVFSDLDHTDMVIGALRAGALGYLQKNTPFSKIKEVLLGVAVGGAYMSPGIARKVTNYFMDMSFETDCELTSREKQIINCLTEGLSYKMMASELYLSIDTVRFHLRNIYKKLHVNSKSEVIAKVLRNELILK